MKTILRTLFYFALNPFESGTTRFDYKKSHRIILIIMGVLFSGLASFVASKVATASLIYYFPALIFGTIGFLGFVIGFLGNDRAVATIWGNTEN